MSDFAERLRSSGKRLTPQRELILRAVDRLGHATPDEVLVEVRKQSSAVNVRGSSSPKTRSRSA